MDNMTLAQFIQEFGWIGAILYFLARDVVPFIREQWAGESKARRDTNTKRMDREFQLEEERLGAWRDISENLARNAVEMGKVVTQLGSVERMLLQMMSSQAIVLERIGRGDALYTDSPRPRRPPIEPPTQPEPDSSSQ